MGPSPALTNVRVGRQQASPASLATRQSRKPNKIPAAVFLSSGEEQLFQKLKHFSRLYFNVFQICLNQSDGFFCFRLSEAAAFTLQIAWFAFGLIWLSRHVGKTEKPYVSFVS